MSITLDTYKPGELKKGYQYNYFLPSIINDDWEWTSPAINQLLEKAAVKLGELNAFSRLVPDIDLFIRLHVTNEAVLSSRIEGTQTNMDEALLPESEISPERKNEWREVNNYIRALNHAISELATLPISSRLIRQTHAILMNCVRGEHKAPGEFRNSQNWIGGASLADATFIPPSQEHVLELMGDLEKFLNNDALQIPALIRIAIAHYQFETIHPFLDGNGRIGRLLITLYLVAGGVLDRPLLYLSAFFERNKGLYYDNLTFVRTRNDMQQWLKYFLVGVAETATQASNTLSRILQLKTSTEKVIGDHFGRRAPAAYLLLNHLFREPVISVDAAAKVLKTTYRPANTLVALMQEHKILREITGQTRNRLFIFDPYLRIFDTIEQSDGI
ncbi:MAG: Fic family protein, partial [Pseudomonadales bacterium]|nr:Fic family protein [Pseudomonadales bacterium]